MKKFFSGISIVVMLMIVVSSIVQFHHHDDKGNIIFAVTSICCAENCSEHAHSHHSHTSCCDSGHHHDHDCGDGENCSAHLGDYQATKQTSLTIDHFPTLLLSAIICEQSYCTANTDYYNENLHIQHNTPIQEGIRWVIGLRAPPYC